MGGREGEMKKGKMRRKGNRIAENSLKRWMAGWWMEE
jgi:hypothetical protein